LAFSGGAAALEVDLRLAHRHDALHALA